MRIEAIKDYTFSGNKENQCFSFLVKKGDMFIVDKGMTDQGTIVYIFKINNIRVIIAEPLIDEVFKVVRKNQEAFYWICVDEENDEYKCPVCRATAPLSYDDMYYRGGKRRVNLSSYCPNCGTKLEEY